jgi:Spy/CpxP family protein refolding chaperone
MILLSAALGCGGNSPQTSSPQSQADVAQAQPKDQAADSGAADDQSTAALAEHHRHHHHGGFAMFIAMSLDGLNTTPEQQDRIEKIQSDMHTKMQPAHDAEKQILLALADGVAAGNVDRSKLEAAAQQLATAAAGIHDGVVDSLNQLHTVLTPPQRQALVDKVEAHVEVWHHTNADDEAGNKDKNDGQIDALAKALSLTPQQVEQISAAYMSGVSAAPKFDRAEADSYVKAFAEGFTADHFEAKSLTAGAALNEHMATWGISRTMILYSAAAPILTPEQRTKAATELRRHANYKRSTED